MSFAVSVVTPVHSGLRTSLVREEEGDLDSVLGYGFGCAFGEEEVFVFCVRGGGRGYRRLFGRLFLLGGGGCSLGFGGRLPMA